MLLFDGLRAPSSQHSHFGFRINVKRCVNSFPLPYADLPGLPVAFNFNASELPLSKLKPRPSLPDSSSTQMRQQEVFAVDSSVKPADVFSVCVCVCVCVKHVLSEASAVVSCNFQTWCSVAGISGVKLLFTVY